MNNKLKEHLKIALYMPISKCLKQVILINKNSLVSTVNR